MKNLEDFKKVAPLIVQAMEDLACTFANTDTPEKAYPLFEHFFSALDRSDDDVVLVLSCRVTFDPNF